LAVEEERGAAFNSYATDSLEEAHDAIAAHYYDLRLEVAGQAAEFATALNVVDLGARRGRHPFRHRDAGRPR
jgi:hypothetical protein